MVVWRVFEIGHAKSCNGPQMNDTGISKKKQDLQTSARKRYHTWAVLSLIFRHGYMSEYVTTGETHLHPSTFTSSQKRLASLHHCPRGGEAHERLRLVKLFWSQDISLHSLGKKMELYVLVFFPSYACCNLVIYLKYSHEYDT